MYTAIFHNYFLYTVISFVLFSVPFLMDGLFIPVRRTVSCRRWRGVRLLSCQAAVNTCLVKTKLLKAQTDILDQSALLVFFVFMSFVLQVKETEKPCGHN